MRFKSQHKRNISKTSKVFYLFDYFYDFFLTLGHFSLGNLIILLQYDQSIKMQ